MVIALLKLKFPELKAMYIVQVREIHGFFVD